MLGLILNPASATVDSMSDKKNSRSGRARSKSGFLRPSRTVGRMDEHGTIREGSGLLGSRTLGSVDQNGVIRGPDGWVFRGEQRGRVRGNRAHDNDGILFPGAEFGYVDDDGMVRLRDGTFRGRVIGEVRGNPEAALGYFVNKFAEIEQKVADLEEQVNRAESRKVGKFHRRVTRMLEWVPGADALGDFDALVRRLKHLERETENALYESRREKARLCGRAEALSHSSDWRDAGNELKALMREWKVTGWLPPDESDELWSRFRAAFDRFYERRQRFFDERDAQQRENLRRKSDIVDRIETLTHTNDWKSATREVKELQSEWKSTGYVPREYKESSYREYRAACDSFFEARRDAAERRQREWRERMEKVLERKEEQAERIRDFISRNESHIERWQSTIDGLRPGGRSAEIESDLRDKIRNVEQRICQDEQRLEELERSISDIRDKLRS